MTLLGYPVGWRELVGGFLVYLALMWGFPVAAYIVAVAAGVA